LTESKYRQFWQLLYWSSHTFIFYFVVPSLAIKFVLREKLSGYGLKVKGALLFGNLYAFALIAIFPVVVYASFSSHFQITYPFFVPLDRNDLFPYFFVWELFYILQFFALEFFFRGFMVQGLKNRLGIYSVFVMMVPYCMIHFGKPLPECVGSIFAGVFLGFMSYRTNSIWLGAFLHICVALSMDLLSLWHKGYF
jgi:membrane protease YdiL (CAAX protease family)